jgi:hypothetical protein
MAGVLATACVSAPPVARTLTPPDSASVGGLVVAATLQEDVLVLSCSSTAGEPFEAVVRVPPVVIGRFTTTVRALVGYREEIVCEGDVCRPVEVPVYEDQEQTAEVEGNFAVHPRRIVLPPGGEGAVRIRMLNPEMATDAFALIVRVHAREFPRWGSLQVDCPSELLGLR